MSIAEWIETSEMKGMRYFTFREVCEQFSLLSRQVVKNNLFRMRKERRIYSPYREFYVILPTKYRLRGCVPPMFYMSELMKTLGRKHYFSLLSAGVLWGAAHQRPQVDFVAIEGPGLFTANRLKRDVEWIVRTSVPEQFIVRRPGEDGDVCYSNAELTAVELVQYEQKCGGLSQVATVLRELLEHTDFAHASDGAFRVCKDSAVQRLGYIVECVLGDERQGEIIYHEWVRCCPAPHFIRLSTRSKDAVMHRDERWKVDVNITIEEDDQ